MTMTMMTMLMMMTEVKKKPHHRPVVFCLCVCGPFGKLPPLPSLSSRINPEGYKPWTHL